MSTATATKTVQATRGRGRPVGTGKLDFRNEAVTAEAAEAGTVSFKVAKRFGKIHVLNADGTSRKNDEGKTIVYSSRASLSVALCTAAKRHPNHIDSYFTKVDADDKNVINVTIVKPEFEVAA